MRLECIPTVHQRPRGKGPRTKKQMRRLRMAKQNVTVQNQGVRFGRKLRKELQACG